MVLIKSSPTTINTGQMEHNNPRISGSAISPRNIGTAVKDNPSVIPAKNLATSRGTDVSANPITIHGTKNGTAEKRINFFHPRMSVTRPVTIRGMIANQELSISP